MWWLNNQQYAKPVSLSANPVPVILTAPQQSPAALMLANANAELRAPQSVSVSTIKRSQADNARLEQAAAKLKTEAAEQRAALVQEWEAKLAELRRASEVELAQALESARAERQTIEKEFAQHATQWRSQIAELEQAAEQSEVERNQTQQAFDLKWTESQQHHAEEVESFKTKIDELHAKCLQHETAFSRLEKKLSDFETEAVTQLTQAHTNFDDKRSEHDKLAVSFSDLKIVSQQREAELLRLRDLLASVETEAETQVAVARDTLNALRRELNAEHESERQRLSDTITQLQHNAQRYESQRHELQKTLTDRETDLERQLAAANQRAEQTQAEWKESETSFQDQIDGLLQAVGSLDKQLGVKQAALDEAETDFADREAGYAEFCADLEQELHAAKEECRLRAEETRLKAEEARLKAEEASATRDQAERYRLDTDQLRQHLEQTEQRHAEVLTELRQQLANTKNRVRDSESTCQRQQTIINEREATVAKMQKKIDGTESSKVREIQSLQQQLSDLLIDLNTAKASFGTADKESKRLAVSLASHSAEHDRTVGQQNTQITRLQDDNKQLREEMRTLQATLEAANKTINERADQKKVETPSPHQQARQIKLNELSAQCQSLNGRLQSVQRELVEVRQRRTAEKAKYDKAVAMVYQLKATIAWLEEDASTVQQHLQREAASRRKAEAALKREAQSPDVDPDIHARWVKIDQREQDERLNRELDAARAMLKAEQQRVLEMKRQRELSPKQRDKPAA